MDSKLIKNLKHQILHSEIRYYFETTPEMITEHNGHKLITTDSLTGDKVKYKNFKETYKKIYDNCKEESLEIEILLASIVDNTRDLKEKMDSFEEKSRVIAMSDLDEDAYISSCEFIEDVADYKFEYFIDMSYCFGIAFSDKENIGKAYALIDAVDE